MKIPFNSNLYQGRAEPYENDLAHYYYQHIKHYANQPICLIGFACDQGVNRNQGRIGAKNAPDMIKNAFGKLPISWQLQKSFQDLDKLIGDKGNVTCDDNNAIIEGILETTQDNYAKEITAIIQNNSLPIAIGGGHEIAFGSFMGLYNALSDKKNIGIINLDAHFDLRNDKYATSGTPFCQIAEFLKEKNETFHYLTIGISDFGNTASLFKKAENLGVTIISESDCCHLSFDKIQNQIDDFMNKVDCIYLTLDLDCLQAGFMPAVSAVNAKGLTLDFVENTLAHIIKSGKVKVIDIAEFNPNYDIDGRGAKVTARLLAGMVQNVLLKE
ncbi:formimidoylglutamase [Moraxella nasibovis]|uniref:formimidoylglutamase n=1 Tax=Moraxella nasibovis TaxID=2904120 RepID=UPI00240F5979|nr:formimidoylglutamase [Moraxella nasibovis]WFF39012.1 formimidoylglutamase [Moraxella nasibovis]